MIKLRLGTQMNYKFSEIQNFNQVNIKDYDSVASVVVELPGGPEPRKHKYLLPIC